MSASSLQKKQERRPLRNEDTRCEFLGWSPKWLQKFATIRVYVAVYGLVGLAQFTLGSYMVATVTAIEKRFKISSRTSGIILSAWDIGSICCLLIMAYLGSRGRKTQWVAVGTYLVGVSSLIRVIPHLIYGPGKDTLMFANTEALPTNNDTGTCEKGPLESCLEKDEEGSFPSIILFSASLLLGAGGCVYYTLGVAYLDDNASKNKVPWLLALVFSIRMFGPTIGFMLAAYCLDIYIDPTLTPSINSKDPRWIGAWWLGWIPLGIINIVLATMLLPFPRELPSIDKNNENARESTKNSLSLQDFKTTMKRLFKNKILMYNSVSTTLAMFGFTGYWSFMPKYLETQFHRSAAESSFITGSIGLVFTALGVIASGGFISYFKPRPRYLAGWNVFVEALDVVGHFSYAFLGCPTENLQGHWDIAGNWNMNEACNMNCSCGPSVKYIPLCSSDGLTTFYSPCHAGCTTSFNINNTRFYSDCSCSPEGIVKEGVCIVDCERNFMMFIIILCSLRFFGATGRAGNTIIQFRSVNPEDKSISIALSEAMFAAFAFIPGPIIYGELLDATCLVWGSECGETGNCWLYNGQTLRYYLNFVSSGFLFLALLADFGVWKYVKDLKIYEDEVEKKQERNKEVSTNTSQENAPFLRNGNHLSN